MKIRGYVEAKVDSAEDFEAKYPGVAISHVDGREFMFWCVMCPEPVLNGQTFVFVDEDNIHLPHTTSKRKAHVDHLYPKIDRDS